MVRIWAAQRYMRFLFGGSALAGGFMGAELLLHQDRFSIAVGVFAIVLAALVGTGKLASP